MLKLKKLILVPHGVCEPGRNTLSDLGALQMSVLARVIEPMIRGLSATICASSSPKATQSYRLLAQMLGVNVGDVEKYVSFLPEWEDSVLNEHMYGIMAIIDDKGQDFESVILVGHFEYLGGFPSFFVKKKWDKNLDHKYKVIMPGQALFIDCVKMASAKDMNDACKVIGAIWRLALGEDVCSNLAEY